MSRERLSLVSWIYKALKEDMYEGLKWHDEEMLQFFISWKHASRHEWSERKDSELFRDWAIYTKRFVEGNTDPNPKKWKANFRCALNASPDIKNVKGKCELKGKDAFRVFQFNKNRTSREKVCQRSVGIRLANINEKTKASARGREKSRRLSERNRNNKRLCHCNNKNNVVEKIKNEVTRKIKIEDIKEENEYKTIALQRTSCQFEIKKEKEEPCEPLCKKLKSFNTNPEATPSFGEILKQITNWSPGANNTNSTVFHFPSNTTVELGLMKFITNENTEAMINLPNQPDEPMQYLDEITNEDITTLIDDDRMSSDSSSCSESGELRIIETVEPFQEQALNFQFPYDNYHQYNYLTNDLNKYLPNDYFTYEANDPSLIVSAKNPLLSSIYLEN